jgi:hypothetical protein
MKQIKSKNSTKPRKPNERRNSRKQIKTTKATTPHNIEE